MTCDLCGQPCEAERCDRCAVETHRLGSDRERRGHQCASCDQPAPAGVTICRTCEKDTLRRLRWQEGHRRELLTTMAKMARSAPLSDGGRQADPALSWAKLGPLFLDVELDPNVWEEMLKHPVAVPFVRSAANSLHSQRSLLVSWSRLLWEERQIPLPPDSVVAMAAHLVQQMPALRIHVACGELVAELAALTGRMVAVYGSPPVLRSAALGPCPKAYPAEHGEEPCRGKVTAYYVEEPYMECSICRAQWDSTQWARTSVLILRLKQQREAKTA